MGHFFEQVHAWVAPRTQALWQESPFSWAKCLYLPERQLLLHLLPIPASDPCLAPNDLLEFSKHCGLKHIALWEDAWLAKPAVVQSRLQALLGQSQRLHGRATKARRIDKPLLDAFLAENHLSVVTQAKYKYGLFAKERLVAVASFGPVIQMVRDEIPCKSGELIRFCSLSGHTVVGGLDKLLQAFLHEKRPDDLMTYADRDWSDGESYLRLGFECMGETPPQAFWVHPAEKKRVYAHRLPFPEEEMRSKGYFPIFNMGNLKFLKRVHT